ncbi:transcriptional regulator NrdR [Thalassoroseus pseudoceratinae]|uniref:transcriptional regulator NrdR n=1 Tax=Thalassoroseus pseudoceratinae TaxID=2713176 RepID=UPI0014216C63|nr:transcriptional regulator NrdR [Thalassoroseus pseudoceratinae]
MHCPFCRQGETRVIDSRASHDFVIRRRRECLHPDCRRRFTTYEKIEQSTIKVVKKNGNRVPFCRERLRAGIEKACWKRPVSEEQVDAIIAGVESEIHESFEREVNSRFIGERVIEALRELDQVAFVRFASVYRDYEDVNDFVEELEPILRTGPAPPR